MGRRSVAWIGRWRTAAGARHASRLLASAPMTVAAVILSATAEGALADPGPAARPPARRHRVVRRRPADRRRVARSGRRRRRGPRRHRGGPRLPGPRRGRARSARWSAASSWPRPRCATRPRSLIWPARMAWVGPETITSLIEAHGIDPRTRPAAGLAGRARLAGARAARPPRRTARDRARPDAARRHRRPRGRGPDAASSSWAIPGVTHDVDTPLGRAAGLRGPARPAGRPHPRMGRRTSRRKRELPAGGRRRLDGMRRGSHPPLAARRRLNRSDGRGRRRLPCEVRAAPEPLLPRGDGRARVDRRRQPRPAASGRTDHLHPDRGTADGRPSSIRAGKVPARRLRAAGSGDRRELG